MIRSRHAHRQPSPIVQVVSRLVLSACLRSQNEPGNVSHLLEKFIEVNVEIGGNLRTLSESISNYPGVISPLFL